MAARKSAKRPRKKAGRKKAGGKGASRAKKKPARKAARKRKAAPRTPTAEVVARRIVRATQDPSRMSIPELYTEDCISVEPGGDPVVGHAAVQGKLDFWEQLQDSAQARWTARNVFVKRNTVCIEWDAEVTLRGDGRAVRLQEVAIHELKGGKIARERYYYDPAVLGGGGDAEAAPAPEPEPPAVAAAEPGRPPVDPIDL